MENFEDTKYQMKSWKAIASCAFSFINRIPTVL